MAEIVSALNKPKEWWSDNDNYVQWLKDFFAPKVLAAQNEWGIKVPHKFIPRPYQIDVVEAMYTKRFVAFSMNRRSGKDYMSVSMLLVKMMEKVGNYVYLFPTATQARTVVWDGIDNEGEKFTDHIPKHLIKINPRSRDYMINSNQMKITLINGSTIQLVGSDNYDRTLVGTNFAGIIFSEYSLSDPKSWVFARPIVAANNGWAWFNGTPRGKNHFYKLVMGAMNNDLLSEEWYGIVRGNDETQTVTDEELDLIRAEGQSSEQLIQQEYYCAWEGCLEGVIYADQISEAQKEGRFDQFTHDRNKPVYVSWDIGVGDYMALTLFQIIGNKPLFIDFYANKGMGLLHYKQGLDDMKAKYKYSVELHIIPHDAKKRSATDWDEEGYALSFEDMFKKMFKEDVEVIPRCANLDEDIEVVRANFHRWSFNTGCFETDRAQFERIAYFFEAMEGYSYPEDDKSSRGGGGKPGPKWTTNPMDSWRYGVKAVVTGKCSENRSTWISSLDEEHGDCADDEDIYNLI
jgi:hypothetical protein